VKVADETYHPRSEKTEEKKKNFYESKRVNIAADPLLTNPLNSCTKLQISAT
jgi:hypothetical protein